MSWDSTRRQVRSLEAKLDAALNRYSRLAVDISGGQQAWPGSEAGEAHAYTNSEIVAIEEEIETALGEVSLAHLCSKQKLTLDALSSPLRSTN